MGGISDGGRQWRLLHPLRNAPLGMQRAEQWLSACTRTAREFGLDLGEQTLNSEEALLEIVWGVRFHRQPLPQSSVVQGQKRAPLRATMSCEAYSEALRSVPRGPSHLNPRD
jgi:hypothetical protein